jgi:hypothetical protein
MPDIYANLLGMDDHQKKRHTGDGMSLGAREYRANSFSGTFWHTYNHGAEGKISNGKMHRSMA